jgi:tetratricopeptide (TPR) repeat protein
MTSAKPSATLGFVDRVEEMKRILDALKVASEGKGQLLLVRGEAGSGKTRLLQEAASEAEKQGFSVGFGTALAESVVPYHPWEEVLENLGLEVILKELPPPRLVRLDLITTEGDVRVKVERQGSDSELLSDMASALEEFAHDPKGKNEVAEGGFNLTTRDGHRLVLRQGSHFHLVAIIEGDEDEAFLADMMALGDKAESILSGEAPVEGPPDLIMETHLRQLLDSEIYEGIDYAKEDPKLRQNKLFEHVTLGLSRKARRSPLCVVIDDLQWADPSSLALLQYVTRNTQKTGVSILGAYRVEEAEARHHLKESLKGMEKEGILNEMDLNGLTREDLSDLAGSFIGSHSLSDEFLDSLWRETRGFPLLVREVLLGLEDDGEIVMQGYSKCLVRPLEKVTLPKRVRDVIRARLDRLSDEDRRLLDVAATCGTRFTASLVSSVAGEEERRVLNGLDAIAKVHGLLRTTDSGFAFDHPAVQEVLYEDVLVETRRSYHREAGKWLELAGAPIEDVARQYFLARDPRAVMKLKDAAEDARKGYSNEEGIRFCLEALELESKPEDRSDILKTLGFFHTRIGNLEEAFECLQHAVGLTKFKERQASIKARLANLHRRQGDFERALQACVEGIQLVEGDGTKAEALVLMERGWIHGASGNPSLALEDFTESLKMFEAVGDKRGIARCLWGLGLTYYETHDYARVLEWGQRLLIKSNEIYFVDGVSASLNLMGIARFHMGENEAALDLWKQGLSISRKMGDADGVDSNLHNIGNVYCQLGEWDQALNHYSRALEGFKKTGRKDPIVRALTQMVDVYLGTDDFDKALQTCREAERIAAEGDFPSLEARVERRFAGCYIKSMEFEEALKHCNRAFSIAKDLGHSQAVGATLHLYGVIYRHQGDWDRSMDSFQQSLDVYEEIGAQAEAAEVHLEMAVTHMNQGDKTNARAHMDRSTHLYEQLGRTRYSAGAKRLLDELTSSITGEKG